MTNLNKKLIIMGLKDSERRDLVKYRLEKSYSTFAEVQVQLDNKFYRTAANRLYYACFYAAAALLIGNGYETNSHNAVKRLLGLYFIKENKLDKSYGKTYELLLNMRQKGDYEDWIDIKEEDIAPLIEPAQKFIKEIEKLININP